MKRLIIALALISLLCAAAVAQTLAPNTAVVLVNGASLSEDTNKVLKAVDYLTLGDIVLLMGRTGSFADGGAQKDFTRVKAPNGKEGWVRTQYIATKASLAIVKADQAMLYTEPKTVKLTSRYVSSMVLVAVLQDGSSSTYAKVQYWDAAQNTFAADSAYVRMDDLAASPADVSAGILLYVSKGTKDPAIKKNLLRVAKLKYGGSQFMPKVAEALAALP